MIALPTGRAIAALLMVTALTGCGAKAQPVDHMGLIVHGQPVALDPHDPSRTRVGELSYAGGLVLSSAKSERFGGFSGLAVRPDGRFLTQSDEGWLMRGRIVTDAKGELRGVTDSALTPLLDPSGRPFPRKDLADAEDITFLSDLAKPGTFAVSFEGSIDRGRSRVSIYNAPNASERVVYRAEWADTVFHLKANYSFEAITQCPGEATFLLGSEDGQIARLDPKIGRIENRNLVAAPPGRFKLTGLDCLPGGRVFALYRAFDPIHSWRAMVALLTWAPSPKGPILKRRELARLGGALTRDNMEGIAGIPRPGGGARLYLISDDNFDELESKLVGGQRTLLLGFDWTPPPAAR